MWYYNYILVGGIIMAEYRDEDRNRDFDFFVKNYQKLFNHYGHKFIAIKNEKVLGAYDSVLEAINILSENYEPGTYIIQECTGDENAYRTSIMRLMIKG